MRESFDGFQGGLQIGGQMVTNLRYSDDIILLATSEELVDRLDRVSRKYSLLINVDKTKVTSDVIACCIFIQNPLLEQVDTFPYLEGRRSRHHCSISFVSFSGENVHFLLQKKHPSPFHFLPMGLL